MVCAWGHCNPFRFQGTKETLKSFDCPSGEICGIVRRCGVWTGSTSCWLPEICKEKKKQPTWQCFAHGIKLLLPIYILNEFWKRKWDIFLGVSLKSNFRSKLILFNFIEFLMTKVSQISISPSTLCLKVPKSPSKKSHTSRAYQQYQECAPISIKILFLMLLIFFKWFNIQ